jgi:NAD(P)H-hydrate epimerase
MFIYCSLNDQSSSEKTIVYLAMTCTVRQMQEADRRAITELGIPGCILMYNAGKSVSDFILSRYPSILDIGILAGKGNNAGDGFVIAHLLSLSGRRVRVVCLSPRDSYVGDARTFLNLCLTERLNVSFPETPELMVESTVALSDCGLIVDAILGTGTRGQVREPIATVIGAVPSGVPIVAVDLPSGFNADTGEICGVCVRAKETITFAAIKQGLVGHPEWTGELIVADIGMPAICLDDEKWEEFKRGQ